ncbi:MAG: glycosyltransferase, partial [Erysipelotrichaceae bacterium]|nr:glycosyltransferase [Erysipelotrichaceae bacterium]
SINTKNRLSEAGVKTPIKVISNGIVRKQFPAPDISRVTPPYVVLNTGRYSVEKDQMTLLDAMPYSKHAGEIQLVFAGKGPLEDKLRKKADQLYNNHILTLYPSFVFLNSQELAQIEVNADLFVHCAVVEVEGMSCMEAVQSGLVPVIATSRYSAASEFTLNPQSRFKAGHAKELADRIDYWLDDKKRREEESKKYPSYMEQYDISISIQKLEAMFQEALQ